MLDRLQTPPKIHTEMPRKEPKTSKIRLSTRQVASGTRFKEELVL
jgi:hypothetical protein